MIGDLIVSGGRIRKNPSLTGEYTRSKCHAFQWIGVFGKDIDSIATFRPHHGGFLETAAPGLGERIEAGDVLGRIINPYTFEVLEEMHNPVPNGVMILSHLTRNLVQPGDYGYMVGSPV